MIKILFFLCILPSFLSASEEQEVGLKLSLISESASIAAGETVTMGLHIQHNPEYHTYWKSPGIVGMATALKWELPDGFTASKISWPYPELCDMAGHPCHGYERDVTLLTSITLPTKIESTEITFKATATWMCCARTCHPGRKELSLTLPVSNRAESNPTSLALIRKAEKEVPSQPEHWSVHLLTEPGETPLTLSFEGPHDEEPEYFFSSDGQISSDEEQVFQKTDSNIWQLSINRSPHGPKGEKELSGILKTSLGHYTLTTIAPR